MDLPGLRPVPIMDRRETSSESGVATCTAAGEVGDSPIARIDANERSLLLGAVRDGAPQVLVDRALCEGLHGSRRSGSLPREIPRHAAVLRTRTGTSRVLEIEEAFVQP